MAQFIRFELDDGTSVLIEAVDSGGPTKASGTNVVTEAHRKFSEAMHTLRPLCMQIRRSFESLESDETEVTFALKTTGEFDFAVAKLGAEANFQVALTWKKKYGE